MPTENPNNFWLQKIKIKNLEYPRFMAAPMDGITDSPMRQLMREFSPEELLFGEMRHVASIVNARKDKSLEFNKIEHPLCFQVSANSTNFVEQAVEKILEKQFDMINLNAGCPAKKVISSGSGSALMANLDVLKNILVLLHKTINNKIPLTLKIRAGFKEKNALYVCHMAQDLGIDAIIIHPRTQPEGFTAPLDFELVKKIKESIQIPVIFSGNINNFEKAKKTYNLTGVDGFMIGRALYGSPWKLKELTEEAKGNKFTISTDESVKIAQKHLDFNSKFYGLSVGFKLLKQHVSQYVKSFPNAAQIRKNLVLSNSAQEMNNLFIELLKEI